MDPGSNTDSTPDLQSILATLARFAPSPSLVAVTADDGLSLTPPARISRSVVVPSSHLPFDEFHASPKVRQQCLINPASPNFVIDPATITTWQDGLRCVTKIASENSRFASNIRQVRLNVVSASYKLQEPFNDRLDDERSASTGDALVFRTAEFETKFGRSLPI